MGFFRIELKTKNVAKKRENKNNEKILRFIPAINQNAQHSKFWRKKM